MNSTNQRFIPNSRNPIRFENLRPGSFFQIVAEPSRVIRKSNDARIYQKSLNGFYSEQATTQAGCVLMPQDIVSP